MSNPFTIEARWNYGMARGNHLNDTVKVTMSILFGITFGMVWLSTVPPTNGLVAQIFGTKYLSTLFGIVFLSHQVGSFLGAFLGGYFYDLYGSYDYAWYLAIALSAFAALVHLPIDERPIVRVRTSS